MEGNHICRFVWMSTLANRSQEEDTEETASEIAEEKCEILVDSANHNRQKWSENHFQVGEEFAFRQISGPNTKQRIQQQRSVSPIQAL